jgi:hypothetical protein
VESVASLVEGPPQPATHRTSTTVAIRNVAIHVNRGSIVLSEAGETNMQPYLTDASYRSMRRATTAPALAEE